MLLVHRVHVQRIEVTRTGDVANDAPVKATPLQLDDVVAVGQSVHNRWKTNQRGYAATGIYYSYDSIRCAIHKDTVFRNLRNAVLHLRHHSCASAALPRSNAAAPLGSAAQPRLLLGLVATAKDEGLAT